MISYQSLLDVCVKQDGQSYFVGEVIPEKKLENARKRYPIPARERIVALIDTTTFGSAKTGIAICESGLYWRNYTLETQRTYVSWPELATMKVQVKGVLSIQIDLGYGVVLELTNAIFNKHAAAQILSDIQHLVRSPSSEGRNVAGQDFEWMLAANGQQFGPYNAEDISSMLAEGRIRTSSDWAWRQGMKDWVIFDQVPELAATMRSSESRGMKTPPPPPAQSAVAPNLSRTSEERRSRTSSFDADTVDINNGHEEELLSLPSLSVSSSRSLIQERERRGGFDTVQEAGFFLQLQPHQVVRLQERSHISPFTGTRRQTGRIVDF